MFEFEITTASIDITTATAAELAAESAAAWGAATHVEVTVDETDQVIVRLVHIDDDDHETVISETTTTLRGAWANTDTGEQLAATVVAAGMAPDFERSTPGVWTRPDGVETYAIHGAVI